ncbi:hypothetical protein [Gemmobacter sp. 24YEA27]|uniref:hypothetical protein n=1 Tax=Gemmobacter sp. 24YEA27 TaxID=3040672 RepID=UPI0024B340F7|nr:hypothetical protein [Gemmobacter sp. 24YEA27]
MEPGGDLIRAMLAGDVDQLRAIGQRPQRVAIIRLQMARARQFRPGRQDQVNTAFDPVDFMIAELLTSSSSSLGLSDFAASTVA